MSVGAAPAEGFVTELVRRSGVRVSVWALVLNAPGVREECQLECSQGFSTRAAVVVYYIYLFGFGISS